MRSCSGGAATASSPRTRSPSRSTSPSCFPRRTPTSSTRGAGTGSISEPIMEGDPITLGVTVENVFNTFEWDLARVLVRSGSGLLQRRRQRFRLRRGARSIDGTRLASELEFAALADELKPETRVDGRALPSPPLPFLRLFANVQKSLTDGMSFEPDFYGGAGAELTALSFFHLSGPRSRHHGRVPGRWWSESRPRSRSLERGCRPALGVEATSR